MTKPEQIVLDAGAMVDVLVHNARTAAVTARITATLLHAPAHFDAEVLSALGRLNRAGHVTDTEVDTALSRLARAPLTRHPLMNPTIGGWSKRAAIRLTDALYVELAEQLKMPLITTDSRLAWACSQAEDVQPVDP